MKAEIMAVGTELLMGQVINTNAAEIAQLLAEIGIGVYHQTVVGDNQERLAAALSLALSRVDLLVVCGGLGPTEDDLTRETLAELLGLELQRDEGWEQRIRTLFAERRWSVGHPHELPRNNLRQAMVPAGATLLPNSRGTAPGIYLEHNGVTIVLLPGPPREMRGLMHEQVLPRLAAKQEARGGTAVLVSRVLRVVGVGESRAAELLEPLLAAQGNPTIAPLAHLGEMHLRLTAHAPTRAAATALLEPVAAQIYAILGEAIYGEDGTTLEAAVGALLSGAIPHAPTEAHATPARTIALAESCTGGLLAHRLTNVPGSSTYFWGGISAYSNEAKVSLLGVEPALIAAEGAVSEAVALSMAEGARRALGAEIAVATTGIAGPDGGSAAKPVGLVYIALADARGAHCQEYRFGGSRTEIKERAAHAALDQLRRHLLKYTNGGNHA